MTDLHLEKWISFVLSTSVRTGHIKSIGPEITDNYRLIYCSLFDYDGTSLWK